MVRRPFDQVAVSGRSHVSQRAIMSRSARAAARRGQVRRVY
jgi:hypothetical protein